MTTENPTTTNPIEGALELGHQVREQILASVNEQHKTVLDAVESFNKATESFPKPKLPEFAGAPVLPDLKALTADGYSLALELLTAQRDFSLKLVEALTPAKVV
jgi:hypothetical protein